VVYIKASKLLREQNRTAFINTLHQMKVVLISNSL